MDEYTLSIDYNVLNHLGIHLYSNTPAVISEVVANSYDACAKSVKIAIDSSKKIITIKDDGVGMSQEECNSRFLTVGYQKRLNEPPVTKCKRHVMGRKGIGKLSLFSIAEIIEVHTVKKSNGKVVKSGFILNTADIEKAINNHEIYHPTTVNPAGINIKEGTLITLKKLKKHIVDERFLRRRLARRFSVIDDQFKVSINGKPISISDRDYFANIEFVWSIGSDSAQYANACKNKVKSGHISGTIDKSNGYEVRGWVGTFDEQKSIDEGNNTITLLAWGKIVHEDILKDLRAGGLFTKYLIGEIQADFLDFDELPDIATSDRQRLVEDDLRFQKVKQFVQETILREIQNRWQNWRAEEATTKARSNPKIDEWFSKLGKDQQKVARDLFTKIETLTIPDKDTKRELYRHGILAFEALSLKGNLDALRATQHIEDYEVYSQIFSGLDNIEEAYYYNIVKSRIEVLRAFEDMLPAAKEKVLQKYIFDHLWLLDPSWERASTEVRIEKSIVSEWEKIRAKLTSEERKGRLDIRYKTAAGKHIIIELKKYDVKVGTTQLIDQVSKYRSALEKLLINKFHEEEPHIEIICIIGSKPADYDSATIDNMLDSIGARYITYDTLIRQTKESYADYLKAQKRIEEIQAIVDSIE